MLRLHSNSNEIDASIFQTTDPANLIEKYVANYADNTYIGDTLKVHQNHGKTETNVIQSFVYHDRIYVENLSNGTSFEYFPDYSGEFT